MERMEQTPKTSFIPKQSIGVARTRERRTFNVFSVLAIVALLSVLTLSAGLFFYQEYANRKLDAQKQGLADFKDRFDSSAADDIREIKLLEGRFELAKNLLDKHLSVSELFFALEDRIQQNAQIKSFAFDRMESGSAQVALAGEALSFNTLALQKRELNEESTFEDGSIIFSDINVETSEEGDERVTFGVTADVAIDQITYMPDTLVATTSFATTTSAVTATSTVETTKVTATSTTTQ
jgi:hypothetical protein